MSLARCNVNNMYNATHCELLHCTSMEHCRRLDRHCWTVKDEVLSMILRMKDYDMHPTFVTTGTV